MTRVVSFYVVIILYYWNWISEWFGFEGIKQAFSLKFLKTLLEWHWILQITRYYY